MTVSENQTNEVLISMLTENTGRHMLDSGGAYGRNWERNQEVDFVNSPDVTVNCYRGEINVVYNVYHWLMEKVEYCEELQKEFDDFVTTKDSNLHWLGCMEAFGDYIKNHPEHDANGIYGDGDPFIVNTYNGEDLLSQVLQYTYFELDGEGYVILQVHGGCDVRGAARAARARLARDTLNSVCRHFL